MQVIEAALAFAVTMLVLSLVSSTLVEMIHRIFGMREKGLHYMLGQLFDQVLARYATHAAGPPIVGQSVNALRAAFQQTMASNRAPIALQFDSSTEAQANGNAALAFSDRTIVKRWRKFRDSWAFGDLWSGHKLSTLSLESFMQRLGSNAIGDKIVHAAGQDAETVLRDIAQKFEEYGKDASTYFERRARFLSVMVAISVAFALHVDAVDLFKTFLRDPAVRTAAIDKQQDVMKALDEARKGVSKADPGLQSGHEEVDELRKAYNNAIAQVNLANTQLGDLGVPIGWTADRIKTDTTIFFCADGEPYVGWFGSCSPHGLFWIRLPKGGGLYLGLLLGGLLIGLGAPFWSDAVTNLTNVRTIARAVQVPPAQSAPQLAAPIHSSKEIPQPATPVAIFKVANEARSVLRNANGGTDRPLLNEDGSRASS